MKVYINGDVKDNVINNVTKNNINESVHKKESLIESIYSTLITLQSRKYYYTDEDSKNLFVADILRSKGILAYDESRQGRSGSQSIKSFKSGELDISVREGKNGTVTSIIECFELNSCGRKNTIVPAHINKLINRYDTSGNKSNYVIIYCMTKNFRRTWVKYKSLVEEKVFDSESNLEEMFSKTDIIVGKNEISRNDKKIHLYHLFVDMSTT